MDRRERVGYGAVYHHLFGTKKWRQIRCRTREKINGYGENERTDTGFGLASTLDAAASCTDELRVHKYLYLPFRGWAERIFFFFSLFATPVRTPLIPSGFSL